MTDESPRRRRIRDALAPAVELARTYGARGILRRAVHEAKRRSGWYEHTEPSEPVRNPDKRNDVRLLVVDHAAVTRVMRSFPEAATQAVADAERVLGGEWPYFGGTWWKIGWPPRWHEDPRTGRIAASDRPWTASGDVGGDIKWIWEPSRLYAAWLLPRAWAATGEPRYVDATWQMFHDWWEHNPVGRGPNWYCAQELSFRCFAMIFAASAFRAHNAVADVARLGAFLRVAGARIERTLGHGLSQRNNHGLSEAVGLWTLGVVLPGEPAAARWRARGAAAMRECIVDQFAADGAYIQESLNYHRLAVHVLLWARWVSRATGEPLPAEVERVLRASHDLLAALTPSGELPNYGHQDGALLLPLSSRPQRDAAPLLAHLARDLGMPAVRGAGDEPAAWMGLAPRSGGGTAEPADGLRVTSSGYVVSSHRGGTVFGRVSLHRDHRPAHADALQLEIWLAGQHVALDPGTFAYSEPPPWDNGLAATRVHNTCSVGDRSQMRRRGKFLWTHWSRAQLHAHERRAHASLWLASVRPAWGLDLVHTRLVRHADTRIEVLDHLAGGRSTDVLRLHWNLAGTDWVKDHGRWTDWRSQVLLEAAQPAEERVIVGDPDGVLGWWSPTYGVKEPCTALELEVRGAAAMFYSRFSNLLMQPPLPDDVRAAWLAGDLEAAFAAWTR